MTSPSAMFGTKKSPRTARCCRATLFTLATLLVKYEYDVLHTPLQQVEVTLALCHANEDVKASVGAPVDAGAAVAAARPHSLSEVSSLTVNGRQLSTGASEATSAPKKSARNHASGDSLMGNNGDGKRRKPTGEETEGSALKNSPTKRAKEGEVPQQSGAVQEGKQPAAHSLEGKDAPSVKDSGTAKDEGRQDAAVERKKRRRKKKGAKAPPVDPQAPIEELLDPEKIHRQTLTKTPFSQLVVNRLPTDFSLLFKLRKKTDGEAYQEAKEVYNQAKEIQANYEKNTDIAEAKASPPRKPSLYTQFMEACERLFAKWGKK